tara:strand:- start:817 stop:1185 length:369 start_codon:yes stop_codon:yes gene_type:complete
MKKDKIIKRKEDNEMNRLYLGIIAVFCLTLVAIAYFNQGTDPEMELLSEKYEIVEEVQNYHEMNTPKETYLVDPVALDLDELSFEEAFKICRVGKGPNETFFWRGTWYSTNFKEETINNGKL